MVVYAGFKDDTIHPDTGENLKGYYIREESENFDQFYEKFGYLWSVWGKAKTEEDIAFHDHYFSVINKEIYYNGIYNDVIHKLNNLLDQLEKTLINDTYYFTFGQNHQWKGIKLKDYWIEIKADNIDIAVKEMNKR